MTELRSCARHSSGRSAAWAAVVAAAAMLVAGCDPPPPLDLSGPTADWPHYGNGIDGLRYSPLNQITADNVRHLEVAWRYDSGDVSKGTAELTRSSLQVTPIVNNGRLTFCTPFNRVIALDAETGAELWAFDPQLKLRKLHGAYPLTCRGVSHWLDAEAAAGECRERIFTGTQDAELIALDAATGRPCRGFGEGGRVRLRDGLGGDVPEWEYYTTSPPLVMNELVVVGALVADNVRANAPPGVVRAFDARTGKLEWAWDPVPSGGTAGTAAPFRRGTANVWATMTGDPESSLIFVPTGNATPDYFGGGRDGLDYYSASVVAINATGPDAGTTRWRFQTVHHDLWDYDIGAQPTLFEFERDGRLIPALVVATKMGHVFVLDRLTGEPLFPVEERPVPQGAAPGDYVSPTQPFPTQPPTLYPPKLTPEDAFGFTFWDRGKCRDRIAALRSEGLFTPPSLGGSVHYPGALGGINWGGGAIDPGRNVFVVNQSRVPTVVKLLTREEYDALPAETVDPSAGGLPGTAALYGPMEGTPYAIRRELLSSPFDVPCSAPPWGTLTAVDLRGGTVLWEVPLGTTRNLAPWPLWIGFGVPNIGGPIVTDGGLIFIAATLDGYIRAFDTSTGAELWRATLPYAAHATPITYRLTPSSRQFVVVAAGGHAVSEPGDAIVAFALPEMR